jgi:hypothetical protein
MAVNKTDARKLQRLQAWEPPPNAATIIAAAPDMLAALKALLQAPCLAVESEAYRACSQSLDAVSLGLAAIAKAEGRS